MTTAGLWIYVARQGLPVDAFGDAMRYLARQLSATAALLLMPLLVGGWIYMADVGSRLRRPWSYVTLATAAFGSSLVIVLAIFWGMSDRRMGILPAEVRGAVAWTASSTWLCWVQGGYWGVTMVMVRRVA